MELVLLFPISNVLVALFGEKNRASGFIYPKVDGQNGRGFSSSIDTVNVKSNREYRPPFTTRVLEDTDRFDLSLFHPIEVIGGDREGNHNIIMSYSTLCNGV